MFDWFHMLPKTLFIFVSKDFASWKIARNMLEFTFRSEDVID